MLDAVFGWTAATFVVVTFALLLTLFGMAVYSELRYGGCILPRKEDRDA